MDIYRVYSLHSPSGNEGMPMYYCEKNQGKLQRKAALQSTRLTGQVTSKNVFLVKTAGLCVLQRYKWGWVLRRDDEKYFQKASRQCLGTFNLTTFEYLWVSYDIRPCKLTRQNNAKYLMLTHVYEAWSKWSPEVHISAVSLPSSCNQLTLKGTCTARIKLTRSCPPFTTTKPSNLKMIQIHRTY